MFIKKMFTKLMLSKLKLLKLLLTKRNYKKLTKRAYKFTIIESDFLKGIRDAINATSLNFLNSEMRISYKEVNPYYSYLELRKPVGLYGAKAGRAKIEVVSMWRAKEHLIVLSCNRKGKKDFILNA